MTLPNVKAIPAPRGFAEIPLEDDEEQEPNFDIPQSQEEKPRTYPSGPIRIYESGVDLYYEPSREVAMRYDVVMNVASEVKNPFLGDDSRPQRVVAHPTSIVGILQDPQRSAGSPTTPKATPIATTAPSDMFQALAPERPEYIHVPWEHNTDIVPDLYHLVKVIDDRVEAGKTVLVHCQCGVSRSASLIVAYGLYKNPEMTVQQAYDAVKKRSKWIGPNMNLIMQLQEFKNGLSREFARRDGLIMPRKSSTVPSASTSDSFDRTPSSPPTPRTAPLPPDREATVDRLMSSQVGPFSAGPMEPTAGSFWDTAFRRSLYSTQATTVYSGSSLMSDTPYVDTKGHLVPLVTVVQNNEAARSSRDVQDQAVQNDVASRQSPASHGHSSTPPSLPQFAFDRSSWRSPSLDPLEEPQSASDAEPAGTFSPDLISPRSTEFHMTALQPPSQVESHDTFNILSPPPPNVRMPAAPPVPARAAPAPRAHMESLNSIFSPTSSSFATSTSFSASTPFSSVVHQAPAPFGDRPLFQRSVRNDSLIQGPSISLAPPPRGKARLRSKFSAPNLTQCIQLQKMQDQISSSLPRSLEAEEALMSPRAGEFVANPFHSPSQLFESNLSSRSDTSQFTSDPSRRDATDTPSSGQSDPRSPAQFGISPITRSIWGMI
jgi:tyrosine-protein phosphatase